jgi:hypothetical protein
MCGEGETRGEVVGLRRLKGVLKKWFWSLLLRFFEIKMLLYPNNLIFEKNRASKLAHSD